jgi:DNA-binding cell septation regulator SpoVG
MPAKKMKDGTHKDLVHPLDKSTRQMFEEQVLGEYNRVLAGVSLPHAAQTV